MGPITEILDWARGVAGAMEPWQWEALLRMAVCAAIGGVIGIEREMHGRAAGLRTHILVCLGCGIVMIASNHFARAYADLGADSVVRLDPARLAYGVVAGIGFLGAGVIMKHGLTAHGLTTAASLWCTAAVGLAAGLGMYVVAVCGALMMVATLLALRGLDRLLPSHHYMKLHVTHAGRERAGCAIREAVEAAGGKVLSVAIDWTHDGGVSASYVVRISTRKTDEIRREIWDGVMANCANAQRVRIE